MQTRCPCLAPGQNHERERGWVQEHPPELTPLSARRRQSGAPERFIIGRAGKTRILAMACAMARMRNAAGVVDGGSVGCAAVSPPG